MPITTTRMRLRIRVRTNMIRRMRMRAKNYSTGEIYYPHTLNGSSIAIGRILISIIENYQQENGTISIPDILKNYMKGITSIGNK